jgi:hypothetical protein
VVYVLSDAHWIKIMQPVACRCVYHDLVSSEITFVTAFKTYNGKIQNMACAMHIGFV